MAMRLSNSGLLTGKFTSRLCLPVVPVLRATVPLRLTQYQSRAFSCEKQRELELLRSELHGIRQGKRDLNAEIRKTQYELDLEKNPNLTVIYPLVFTGIVGSGYMSMLLVMVEFIAALR